MSLKGKGEMAPWENFKITYITWKTTGYLEKVRAVRKGRRMEKGKRVKTERGDIECINAMGT